jgi:NAD(P)-dependent dehydrogenase (short-subunit alcohol dehydrogenase family)
MPPPGASPLLPSDLSGRRAVVTGAARGIGHAIALRLAQAGARVLALDLDDDSLIKEINSTHRDDWAGLDCTVVRADLGDDPGVDPVRIAASLLDGDEHDPIQLIVNNVGICSGTNYFDTSPEDFDRIQRTNLRNPWFFTRRLVEPLVKHSLPGSVLFISSLHRLVPSRRPQYDISKAAVSQAARALAAELSPYIRVNAISPGWIDTAPFEESEKAAMMVPQIPLRRAGAPDDVAKLALFLLSDHCAGYLTGVDIPVDGGLMLHTWVPAAS